MTKQTEKFIHGALILSFAGLVAKILSAVYRIPLTDMVGLEGIGYYDTVYPIYSILVAISLVGVPNSVSKLVAEQVALGQYKKAHHVFRSAMILVCIIGLLITGIMVLGSGVIIRLSDWGEEYRYLLYGLALSPFFISITGAIRGYFQGMQQMKYTAISQVIESLGKVVLGLGLVSVLLGRDMPLVKVVAGATVGASLGFVVAAVYMVCVYLLEKKTFLKRINADITVSDDISHWDLAKKILVLTIPITIVSATYSIMNLIDSETLYHIFGNLGYGKDYVLLIFGNKATAFTVVNVPLTISLALSMSVVPAIAQANKLGDIKERNHKINEGIKLSMLVALPASIGIYVLAKPVLNLLYSSSDTDHKFLQVYAICLIFMILGATLAGILQGMSKQYVPLIALAFAIVTKVIFNQLLAPVFLEGYGAPISSTLYYAVFVGINFIFIYRYAKLNVDWLQSVVKPFVASILMGTTAYFVYQLSASILSRDKIATMLSVIVGALIYILALVLLKTLTEEDLRGIPGGKKLLPFFVKYQLLRK